MLAICAALSWEVWPILRAVGGVRRANLGPLRLWESTSRVPPIVVFRTGMGYEAAREATHLVLGARPVRTLINTGCAGALATDLVVGAVVIPRTLLDPSNLGHDADEAFVRSLREAARRAGLPTNDGPILTSRTVLATKNEKRSARERFGATAVEMEGCAVADVAREHSSRFGSVRAILDTSELDIPFANSPRDVLKLALRAATAPQQLVSLANDVKAVQTSLEVFFRCFLDESLVE